MANQSALAVRNAMNAWLWVLAVTAAVALVPVALSQGSVLNQVQEELLAVEALLQPLLTFQGDMDGVEVAILTGTLTGARLNTLVDRAQELVPVVDSAIERLFAVSGPLHTPAGVELTTEVLYRVAAWELRTYAVLWKLNLVQVASSTLASPPKLEFRDMLGERQAAARVYRVLANQQFQIDAIQQRLRPGEATTDGSP